MCHYYYEELSTGFFSWEKYPVKSHPRSQTSNIFVRICADPRSADFCIVLVLNFASFLSLIPSCSKRPASFFDTEHNAPTTTGTTFVLFLLYLYICSFPNNGCEDLLHLWETNNRPVIFLSTCRIVHHISAGYVMKRYTFK